jgi:hypothetical protein
VLRFAVTDDGRGAEARAVPEGDPELGSSYTGGMIGDLVDALRSGSFDDSEQLRRKDAALTSQLRELGALLDQVGNAGGWKDVHHDRLALLTIRSLRLIEEILSEIKPLLTGVPGEGPGDLPGARAPGDGSSVEWTSDGLIPESPEGPPESLRTVGVKAMRADCDDQPVRIVDEKGMSYTADESFDAGKFETRLQVAAGRTLSLFCGDKLISTYQVPPAP